MSIGDEQLAFAVQEFRGILIAPIQVELSEDVRRRLRAGLLEAIQRTGASGVILNLDGLDVLDLREFESLRRTIRMAEIMGARCVVVGLRPGIAAALVALDADVEGLETALTVEHALTLLDTLPAQADPADGGTAGHQDQDEHEDENEAFGEPVDD
jgi:anti-anti-sigma regulatory factor